MSNEQLRVVVITQQERFFIPNNILKVSEICDILSIVNNKSKSSLDNKFTDMLKWFGFFQCFKMGLKTGLRCFQNVVDCISGYNLYGGKCSLKAAAKKIGTEYKVVENVNGKEFVDYIDNLKPDLIISYSAPQIIKPQLLSIPKSGVLNVHGALLPDYRGCLPSFWYLYNDEKIGGATVHYMSEAIDDGDICIQKSVDLSDCKTMFQVMKKTKMVGGEAMVEAVLKIQDGTLMVKPNDTAKGSYYTWPTIEEAKEFRKRGKRLV